MNYSTGREQPNIYATEANCYGFATSLAVTGMRSSSTIRSG